MAKTEEKFIDFGSVVGKVSARSLPAYHTAVNYIPVIVDSEPVDRLSAHLRGVDTKLGLLAGSGFVEENKVLTSPSSSVFPAFDFEIDTIMEVHIFGRLQEEGVTKSYTREAGANALYFTETLPTDTLIQMKFVTSAVTEYNFSATASQTVFQVANLTTESSISVYIEGTFQAGGVTESYTLDVINDTVVFNEPIPENAWVHIKVQ